jgi:hypothetical protein
VITQSNLAKGMKKLEGGRVLEELATWHESLGRLKAHESGGSLPTGDDGLVSGDFQAVATVWYFLRDLEDILRQGLTTDTKSIKEQFVGAKIRVDIRLIRLLTMLSAHVKEWGDEEWALGDEVRKYVLADLDHSQATEVMKGIAQQCQKALECLRQSIGQECLPVFLNISVASQENLNGVLNILDSSEISVGLHARMLAKTKNIDEFYSDVTAAQTLQAYLTKLRQQVGIAGELIFCSSLIS